MGNSTKKNVKHLRRKVDIQSRRQNIIDEKCIIPKKSDGVEINSNIRKRFEIYIRSLSKMLSKRTYRERVVSHNLFMSIKLFLINQKN